MAKKRSTSFTKLSIKQFDKYAAHHDRITCDIISGFLIHKNKASLVYKFRPTNGIGSRPTITIGNTKNLSINEAASIAKQMLEITNNGGNPKDILKAPLKIKTTRSLKKDDDDNRYLGNFFNNVFEPNTLKRDGGAAKYDCSLINNHFEHLFGKKISELTTKDIEDWQDSMEEKGRAYSTILRVYNTLLALISMALKESYKIGSANAGIIADKPFKIKALRGASKAQVASYIDRERDMDASVRRILNNDELQSIETAMLRLNQEIKDKRDRSLTKANRQHLQKLSDLTFAHWVIPFIYIAYYTGLRPGDISSLKWTDLHLGKLKRVTNKSAHLPEPTLISFELNNSKSVFKYSLLEVIDTWRAQQGNPKKGYVFPQADDIKKPIDRTAYQKQWKHILTDAKINIHMYAFRHHFISTLLRNGRPPSLVANLVGHKSIRMIEKHYSHHLPSDKKDALSVF